MDATRIEEVTTDEGWDCAVPILRELWSDVDEPFVRSWREEDDYRLFGRYEGGELVGVVGVSTQRVLHHARHAWIHDIVVTGSRRGEGHGAALLSFVESWARERDCEYVALANRLGNEGALDFYEAEGLEPWGYVVETEL
ncbi:GNAT family N-acetyltransferase [Halorarum halophilum]|uniref:GNAT family N-acetyltransferase n=1 Tax=Halorarum halophilum TaxID=2743090 RepID=A0A7D5KLW1_9EURY|nr:GNAT family N-acetyltransferase [Halobaculum halophilum]QLG27182.1 GNAT family N-acetyltransferase [Halobaculum halophilum]